MDQRLYTVEEAAAFLQLHPKTLRRKIRAGEIESTRVGKRYRLTAAQLQDYLGEDASLLVSPKPAMVRRDVASTVVDVTVVSPELHSQISNYLTAALSNARQFDPSARTSVHCQYFAETAELKIMLTGSIEHVQTLLAMVSSLLKAQRQESDK